MPAPMSPDEPVSLGMNGDLMLKGLTSEDNGLYQCTVANHVGYSVCVVEVKVSGKSGGGRLRSPGRSLPRLATLGRGMSCHGVLCCSPSPGAPC